MKKRIFLTIVVVVLLCMTALTAGAAAEPFVIEPDAARGAISVSGAITAQKSNAMLILRFIDANGTEIFADYTKTKRENNEIVFEFDKIYLPKTLPNGSYTIEISGPDLSCPLSMEYTYSDPFKVLTALRAVADATRSENKSVGGTLSVNNADYAITLGIDVSEYLTFTNEAKEAFETIIKTAEYEIPTGEEDTTQNERELNKLKSAFKKATASASFVMAENKIDVAKWLERFYFDTAPKQDESRDESVLGPDPDANLCVKNEDEEFLKLFNNTKTDDDFINRFIKAEGNYTIAQIKEMLNEMTLLSIICEKTDSEALSVLEDYPEYFAELDWDAYDELTNTEEVEALDAFAGESYESCASAAEAFNEIVDSILSDSSSSGGSGGGGGSSGSGNKKGSNLAISGALLEQAEAADEKNVFTDLEQAAWAKDAILYLHANGIVSGRENGTFSPNDNVTRAEFIKMVISAMSISIQASDNEFSDVKADDWFAPFIAAAYKNGLVNGDANGCFNPNAKITRQDMVTILFRAIGVQANDSMTLEFSDADAISEYARAAVAYFSSSGIVNGMGDGSFGPNANATRAQTATILYKLMTA